MATLELGLGGHAPVGWSVNLDAARRGDTYLSFTRDSELGQQVAPEITVSLLEASGSASPLDVLAHDRRAAISEVYSGVRLRRGEYISERDPQMYGQEIWFETEPSSGDRVAVIQSEILFTFAGLEPRVLSFLLTSPESVFEDCLPDFKALFDSITVQESE
ncbi:Uncharacterised protein [Mycobacteroides abscessus subsp. bolletii]|uniref:hypothetical protein n=1 Tax=Mycobacteroides abscessus TaxID=36809 RepID=UPI000927B39F|nr:hypothetical protein [Mycobacteroides abscessus]MDO3091503.1 hypothetical protein [Mycobacteroides abscessus subsp. abscessus]MDO3104484.1 hypothetical protein [Mycobacteroides abscessus subsp. abscessus]PVB57575.1 hypothetical protein DDK10_07305 [Mycobacteroides abscessus]RIR04889.1 hypothetical protein D2E35_11750 [Mycobacteroides abscessus]RIR31008.1 hypothetical protein D2E38_21295 [Mycobacteroides abscessus]